MGGVASPEATPGLAGLANVFGLRILAKLGPARLVGLIGLVFWVGAIAWLPLVLRPDLLRPADFGSDTSNYVAAAERLVGDSDLYALQAGDRPVPADNPPVWTVPILSPPSIAVAWVPVTFLPGPLELYASWAAGLALTTALGVFLVLRSRPAVVLAILAPMILLALLAWSGNVNAILAPMLALAWWLSARRPSRSGEWTLGAIIGMAAMLKLGPAMMVIWLLGQRRLTAVVAAAVAGLASAAIAVLLGGSGVFAEYVDVVLNSTSEASPMSIPGLLRGLGFSATAGLLALLLVIALGCLAIVGLRRDSRRSFAAAIVLSVVATTVVRPETLVVALVALVPWATHRSAVASPAMPRLDVRTLMAVTAAGVATVAVALSLSTGNARPSSLALINDSGAPVVVRFTVSGTDGTFGFRLEPGQVGSAWLGQVGTSDSPVFVTTPGCDILYQVEPDPEVAALRIGATTAVAVDRPEAAYLDYVPDCAETVGLAAAMTR